MNNDDLAREIAKGALRIDWYDTETAARRVAEYAADRIEELEAENKRLREALKFYAEECDWQTPPPNCTQFPCCQIARAALKETDK